MGFNVSKLDDANYKTLMQSPRLLGTVEYDRCNGDNTRAHICSAHLQCTYEKIIEISSPAVVMVRRGGDFLMCSQRNAPSPFPVRNKINIFTQA